MYLLLLDFTSQATVGAVRGKYLEECSLPFSENWLCTNILTDHGVNTSKNCYIRFPTENIKKGTGRQL